jgi:hypothetical protein
VTAGSDDGALVAVERKAMYDSFDNQYSDVTLIGVWSDSPIWLSRFEITSNLFIRARVVCLSIFDAECACYACLSIRPIVVELLTI